MEARTPPKKPSTTPSKRNGQRMNQSVAPTYFMMAISLRRAKTVRRIVFEMMKSVAPARSSMSVKPKIRTRRVMSKRCSTTSCPYFTDSTPPNFSIAFAAVSTIVGCLTVTSKAFGSGFLSPSASSKYFWSPSLSLRRTMASSRLTYCTLSMPCIFFKSSSRSSISDPLSLSSK